MPCVDANDPNARIITFRPFYFSLGFTFQLPKLFKEVFCAMGCAPSQCIPNVYQVYAQVRIYNVTLFDSLSQGDRVWHDNVLEVSGRWEGNVDGPLVPITYSNASNINKNLEVGPDIAKVRCALNIPPRFC
ncbi:PREDICTED: LOC110760952 partial [Prunus dulcis]|uniref:PREDICTED: LOC110760952 partial n=1 Tax=Prunus dulcis TaxID=3755 RepID=A0A5E4FTS2_PRUDU|nr:PREDICTED: LOC110760952 partial [Prunus dulcis]